jgi:hypothetical protein
LMIICAMGSYPFLPMLDEERTGTTSKEKKPGPNSCRACSL